MQKINNYGFATVLLLVPLVLVLLIGAGWYIWRAQNNLYTVSSGNVNFSFKHLQDAEKRIITNNGKTLEALVIKNPDAQGNIVVTAYPLTELKGDCSENKGALVSGKATVTGKEYSICHQKNKLYIFSFESGNEWYQVGIWSEGFKEKVEPSVVENIVSSVQASQK